MYVWSHSHMKTVISLSLLSNFMILGTVMLLYSATHIIHTRLRRIYCYLESRVISLPSYNTLNRSGNNRLFRSGFCLRVRKLARLYGFCYMEFGLFLRAPAVWTTRRLPVAGMSSQTQRNRDQEKVRDHLCC